MIFLKFLLFVLIVCALYCVLIWFISVLKPSDKKLNKLGTTIMYPKDVLFKFADTVRDSVPKFVEKFYEDKYEAKEK